MRPSYTVLRTHGGLGNQLFQILYARLFADQQNLVLREIHDLNYMHAFARNKAVAQSDAPSAWQSIISAARIPKILERYVGRQEMPLKLAGAWYLDGYFQSADQYRHFDAASIQRQIRTLATELDISDVSDNRQLFHLRLGDFFGGRDLALLHARQRIASIPEGAFIITNDESLLQTPEIAKDLVSRHIQLIGTAGMPAELVIQKMASFQHIDANDSTLAFWAAVLGGRSLTLSNQNLARSYEFFRQVR